MSGLSEDSFVSGGLDHVGLTVPDLGRSLTFFTDCLGWEKIGERPDYPAAFVSDGTVKITLWQVADKNSSVNFNRRQNVGLHHLALKTRSEADFAQLFARVSAWPGTGVEFAPQISGAGPKMHFMIYEPGGCRIEFTFDPRGVRGSAG
ncbi:VOC family protein [Rhizobium bangladeshense]|uniref:VOC family protein n=1 Tax=Rhizobium bangladeshense TaxID=1138189 RepID=A0ABS7LMK1_9HYPH|nr:VOC family protein [Rhizobium bangladeshense]MBY3592301.1 VOC family protein [Rhizobium bangladeshense]QSY97949.1 VOC family protein [Rhizobium bangladeshense]